MSDLRFLVQRYLDEKFGRPHPMKAGDKFPSGAKAKGWQNPDVTFALEDFDPEGNVGTALIHDLVDIDLDCDEAVQSADEFFPPTGRIHGRASKPRSHRFYRVPGGVKSFKFTDIPRDVPNPDYDPTAPPGTVNSNATKKIAPALLEIRSGAKHQTMLPPSVHPEGERLAWCEPFGDPAACERDRATHHSALQATAILLGRHWPSGSRHDVALAVGGFLAGRGVTLEEAQLAFQWIVRWAHDNEPEDRLRALKESYDSFAANRKTTGLPHLKEVMGEEVTSRLGAWWKSAGTGEVLDGGFRLTEAGDADQFAAFGAEVLRYNHALGTWLIVDPETGIWDPDAVGKTTEMAKAFMRHQQKEANNPEHEIKNRKKVLGWYVGGESRSRLNNTLMLAQSVPPLANRGDDWDEDPFLLGCRNGVVDLRTAELRLALPAEHVSKRVQVIYDREATCPLWLSTLADVFAPGPEYDSAEAEEILAFLQRSLGYSLTGDCREECCFICWGSGANGKGTILNTVGRLLGDYRDEMPYSTLEKNRLGSGIPSDIAKMQGKRLITCSEINEFTINENRLKALTGRDPMTARFLHHDFFTFTPVGKIWMATNNRPKIVGQDEGIWRRIHLIPFLRSFVGRENTKLKDALLLELPGILTWLVAGAKAWYERGALQAPKTVRAATDEYRHESNPITPFVEDRCVVVPEGKVVSGDLWRAYEHWCHETHVDQLLRLGEKGFHQAVRQRFTYKENQRVGPAKRTIYFGIGLRSDGEQEPPPVAVEERIPF